MPSIVALNVAFCREREYYLPMGEIYVRKQGEPDEILASKETLPFLEQAASALSEKGVRVEVVEDGEPFGRTKIEPDDIKVRIFYGIGVRFSHVMEKVRELQAASKTD